MMLFTTDTITKAGRILKVIRLVNQPGMDAVAVKLNSELTYDEEKIAQLWAQAFELAIEHPDKSIFELAAMLGGDDGI